MPTRATHDYIRLPANDAGNLVSKGMSLNKVRAFFDLVQLIPAISYRITILQFTDQNTIIIVPYFRLAVLTFSQEVNKAEPMARKPDMMPILFIIFIALDQLIPVLCRIRLQGTKKWEPKASLDQERLKLSGSSFAVLY